MKARTWVVLAVSVGALGTLVWLVLRPPVVPVEVERVRRGRLRVTVDEDGRVRVRDRFVLSSPLAGTLLRPGVRAGDACRPGALLARIVPVASPLLDARTRSEVEARARAADDSVRRAGAALALAATELEQAKRTLERARVLGTSGTVSREALERAETDHAARVRDVELAGRARDVARHELEGARAALLRARDGRGKADDAWDVTCPVGGAILRVVQESEAVVQPGTALFELGDLRDLEVVADVLTPDAVAIRSGAEVVIDHWGGGWPLQARVRRVEPSAFTKVSSLGVEEQRVNVVADLVDPPERRPGLGDGFRVEVHVVTADVSDALLVPLGAILREGDGWTVFAVVDGRATARRVELGRRSTSDAEVLKGLAVDDAVVLYPGESLAPGSRVVVRARPGSAGRAP